MTHIKDTHEDRTQGRQQWQTTQIVKTHTGIINTEWRHALTWFGFFCLSFLCDFVSTISEQQSINGKWNKWTMASGRWTEDVEGQFPLGFRRIFFTVCRPAPKPGNLSLDNLINKFPEYFTHLPHSPDSGRGFIRKFQNWEFPRKFIGFIGEGGEGRGGQYQYLGTNLPWNLDWIQGFLHWRSLFWRSQYETVYLTKNRQK